MYKYLYSLLLLLPAPGCLPAQSFVPGFSYGCEITRKFIVSPAKYRNDSLNCTAEYKWSEFTKKCVKLHTGAILIDGQKYPFRKLVVKKIGYVGSWKYLTGYSVRQPENRLPEKVIHPESRLVITPTLPFMSPWGCDAVAKNVNMETGRITHYKCIGINGTDEVATIRAWKVGRVYLNPNK